MYGGDCELSSAATPACLAAQLHHDGDQQSSICTTCCKWCVQCTVLVYKARTDVPHKHCQRISEARAREECAKEWPFAAPRDARARAQIANGCPRARE